MKYELKKEKFMAEEIVKPQKFQCPKCGAFQDLDARFCSKCGAYIIPGGKKAPQNLKDENQNLKRKKKIIIASVSFLVILVIILGSFWYLKSKRQDQEAENFRTKVKGVWTELLGKTDEASSQMLKTTKVEDFESLSPIFDDFLNFLGQKEFDISYWENVPENYQGVHQKLKDTLKKLSEYLEDFREKIKNPSQVKSEDLTSFKDKAESAQKKSQEFVDEAKFVDKNIKSEFFNTSQIAKIIENFQASEKAKAEEAERKTAKAASESLVLNFLNELPKAYKALETTGDTWTETQRIAKKYWSSEGMVIFREDYRYYFGSETFYKGGEVISSESLSKTKYSILVKEKVEYLVDAETGEKSTSEYLSYFTCQKIGSRWWITDRRIR